MTGYQLEHTCHIGRLEDCGYAFVPGSPHGVVMLDLDTIDLLEKMKSAGRQINLDSERQTRLREVGILFEQGKPPLRMERVAKDQLRSFGAWLHVTNRCNLACPYCYIRKDGSRMDEGTATAFVAKAEEATRRHQLKLLVIRMAGGEPSLEMRLVDRVAGELTRRLAPLGARVEFVCITNGVLMNKRWLEMLKRHEMRVCVSLDGVGHWHDQTRSFSNGRGSFDLVVRSINQYCEAGITPMILTTLTEANVEGVPELVSFLAEHDLPFRFGVYRDTTGGKYAHYDEFIRELQAVLEVAYSYYETAIRTGKTSFKHQFADIRIDKKRHLNACGMGYSGCAINSDGHVFVCQSRMGDRRLSLGTVFDTDKTLLEMVWDQETIPGLTDTVVTEGILDAVLVHGH